MTIIQYTEVPSASYQFRLIKDGYLCVNGEMMHPYNRRNYPNWFGQEFTL